MPYSFPVAPDVQMVRRLGVGTKAVVAALEVLKQVGVLEAPGRGRRNRIVVTEGGKKSGLQIRILRYEESDAHDEHTQELRRWREDRSHQAAFAAKMLTDPKFDVTRVARLVEGTIGDAQIIRTDTRRLVPRVVQWAENVASGREDRRETLIHANSIEGGTIGPAPVPGQTAKMSPLP